MSKPWIPPRNTAQVPPSRIRRDPVRVQPLPKPPTQAEIAKAAARVRQRELWMAVGGITLFALVIAVATVATSITTIFHDDPAAAARSLQFGQCYEATGPNCVLTGDTITVDGARVRIAGIEAPAIQGSACPEERNRGIDSALRLADRLNSGAITLGPVQRDASGRAARTVEVKGEDVGQWMLNAGLAHEAGSGLGWCKGAAS